MDEKNIEEQNQNSSSNQAELFNLIQSIQSKLNEDSNIQNNNSSSNTENDQTNTNNADDNTNSNQENQNINNSGINMSGLSSILQNLDIGALLKNISGNSNTNTNSSDSNGNMFDEKNILRLQKIMSSIGKNDPKKNLLLSLKPFLRKSRQDKINEYITILTVINALGIFDKKGSDENV